MKRKQTKVLSLLMVLAMLTGLANLAFSEELLEGPDEGLGLDTGLDSENTEGLDTDHLPSGLDSLDLSLDGFDLAATVTYRFIVDEKEYATQTAQAGEEIHQPDAPNAPKGSVFSGWVLADGTQLFVDVDGDEQVEPVIVQEYESGTEVYVWAVFADPAEEEAPAEEGAPAAEQPNEEEEPVEEPPVDEQPAEAALVEEQVTETAPVEEMPTEEQTAEEATIEEDAPAEEASVDEQSAEAAPVEEQSVEETPAEEDQTAETASAEEPSVEEAGPAEEQPVEEDTLVEEQKAEAVPAEETSVDEAPAAEKAAEIETPVDEQSVEASAAEEQLTEEAAPAEEAVPAEELPAEAVAVPIPNTLVYTGEAQVLVSGEGWLFSLDGETFSTGLPTAVNAGEYTVFYKKASSEDEARILVVTVDKADAEFIAPVAATGEE